ncbi:GspE/PulE family protein [Hydrogenophaga sp. T2]|uniref:GspE/PulE family protein n=1 Tax=Hydrogenophaga sp. T2 TaxID=3132823 RepID=UPI003CEA94A4
MIDLAPIDITPSESLQDSTDAALHDLARYYGMQAMDRGTLEGLQPDFGLLGFSDCAKRGSILARCPRAGMAEVIFWVQHNPLDLDRHRWIEARLEHLAAPLVVRVLTTKDDFDHRLLMAEQGQRAMDSVDMNGWSGGLDTDEPPLSLSLATIESTGNPTVRLLDSTLLDALRSDASDIHFELQGNSLRLKYRMDGVLQTIKQVENAETAHQVISRIKVLSNLDISERRVPQDGRFRVAIDQREVDFRVSIMPNAFGEDAVLRILDRKHLTGHLQTLTLDSLKFGSKTKLFIRRCSGLPYGLLLVTGPTGSGKTTTLYAAISEINTGLDKIVTIEDPIEYQLPGVLQIPVNEKKGLTFARGLRSVLRHDPDKIMVGEIRDSDTAQIAVQAALTGHQVFTTIHANNVFDVIGRFANMGVDRYSLVAALTGVVAQRLVRTTCPSCAVLESPTDDERRYLPETTNHDEGFRLKHVVGCSHCRGTGYRGRTAIAETLHIDDDMRDLLLRHESITAIKQAALKNGFQSLRDAALELVTSGVTTVDEINRVTPAN